VMVVNWVALLGSLKVVEKVDLLVEQLVVK
jgi:hypothetical protein